MLHFLFFYFNCFLVKESCQRLSKEKQKKGYVQIKEQLNYRRKKVKVKEFLNYCQNATFKNNF